MSYGKQLNLYDQEEEYMIMEVNNDNSNGKYTAIIGIHLELLFLTYV